MLAISRAIGETMIVLIAAGGIAQIAFDPREQSQTMTAFIGATGIGDVPTGSIEYKTIFAVGLTLFVITFVHEHDLDPPRAEVPGDLRMSVAPRHHRTAPRAATGSAGPPSTSSCSSRCAVGFILLGFLLVDVFRKGVGYLDWTLLTEPNSSDPQKAGAGPAILGTIYMMILLLVMVVPIGVGTALYLEEYANRERWYNRLLEINIQNLAAVPSIVYGILGLAFLVRGIGLGRVLLAGALILTLLVLPTVIVASREAIRAVPDSIRQGAYALGATQWQVVWRQVLPAAIPGIATGSILALARAIGETAPLLLVGALTFVAVEPDPARLLHGAPDPDLPVGRRGRRRSSASSPLLGSSCCS